MDSLDTAIRRQRISAGVVLPADYDRKILARAEPEVRFITSKAALVPVPVRAAIAQVVARETTRTAMAVQAAGTGRISLEDAFQYVDRASSSAEPSVRQVDLDAARRRPSGTQFAVPASLVLFIMISVLDSAAGTVTARRSGALRRTLTLPVHLTSVVLGEWLARIILALIQALLIILLGIYAFHVRWGSPVALALMVGAFAALTSSAGILIASWARRSNQVLTLVPVLAIVLGMLGGCFWPLDSVAPALREAGSVLPSTWEAQAVIRISTNSAGLAQVWRSLVGVSVSAAVCLTLAVAAFRRSIAASRT